MIATRRPCSSVAVVAGRDAGFTLVELILALALAGSILAAAWTWLWDLHDASSRLCDEVEARTTVAFARRIMLADLRAATSVTVTTTHACTPGSIALAVPDCSRPDGVVDITWDRARGILWRLTSSCHLADGVESFAVTYIDGSGDRVECGAAGLAPSAAALVRGVRVSMSVRAGRRVVHATWSAWFAVGRA